VHVVLASGYYIGEGALEGRQKTQQSPGITSAQSISHVLACVSHMYFRFELRLSEMRGLPIVALRPVPNNRTSSIFVRS
jgi:hypothetical protein